jgi:2-keto-4-pentenoate hydratase/2-oxohepta-3-ene-1,7-dioic acid hydratase in catechol pathway
MNHIRSRPLLANFTINLQACDIQGKMKKAGQPWEKAKGFDNACPISGFIPAAEFRMISPAFSVKKRDI